MQHGSPTAIDDTFLEDESIFSRFHTHPLNDPEYVPSAPDIGQSMLLGPTVLLSQRKGVFYVYAISKGNSNQIYTAPINKR